MVNTVYNYYLTNYASKSVSRYDAHKRGELQNVYNTILKLNRDAPLYKINVTEDLQKFVIDIKENAKSLKNILTSLSSDSGLTDTFGFGKKIAESSNEDVITAEYIDISSDAAKTAGFSIEVASLATTQVNMGNFLPDKEVSLDSGLYSFDIAIGDISYEFQFGIEDKETNLSLQEKLARMITKSDVGLKGSVIEEGFGHTALMLESIETGLSGERKRIFSISDNNTSKLSGTVEYLGINSVNQYPKNAVFFLDNIEKNSPTNTFTINKTFELTLHSPGKKGEPVQIGFKADIDSIVDNVHELVNGYNSIISVADSYTDTYERSSKLGNDYKNIAAPFKNELESIGLTFKKNGTMEVDDSLLIQSLNKNDISDTFSGLNKFKNVLLRKTNQVLLDPMEYVDKVVVAYKNPGKTFFTPYITSMYSGMMYNRWY